MASYDVLHVTCPVCNTDLLVKICKHPTPILAV